MDLQNKLVIIGLGSNEEPLKHLRQALLKLRQQSNLKIKKVSRIYESDAQTPIGANDSWNKKYLNAAVLIEVFEFEPFLLLKQLKRIEKEIGRTESESWAPRKIDLDILFADQYKLETETLNIPHKLFFERAFAYLPAQEVNSNLGQMIFKNSYDTKLSSYVWPELAAIMNMTPDSFSDGGQILDKAFFLKQARIHLLDGADYLDVGAESTRPGASIIESVVEIERLKIAFDAIKILKSEGHQFKVSLDSRNYETIQKITDQFQVDLINDVSGLGDLRILKLIKEKNMKAVCMHSLTVPADKKITLPIHINPAHEILNWWNQKNELFNQFHINQEHIFFDPGFGFGKTIEQNQYLIKNLDEMNQIKSSFFLGYSRKSFLNANNENWDQKTAVITKNINLSFGQILRLHNIAINKKALKEKNEL